MVSALMPCYGDADLVRRSLPRLLASTVRELDVVLVNNDSGQTRTVNELVTGLGDSRVRILELEHRAGFVKAINAGIEATSAPFVLFATSDLFVEPDYLSTVLEFLERHPRAGCTTGKILRYELSQDRETEIVDSAGHAIGRDRGVADRGENHVDIGQYQQEEEVFSVSGAALVARRDALESVRVRGEYLDESFFMYKEDVDLSWRLRLAGWECWYVPAAVAYHARTSRGPTTVGNDSSFRAFHENERRKPPHVRTNSMKNQWLMLVKNEDASNLARDLPFVLGREILILGYNAIFAPRVTASAVRQFVAALPRALESRRAIKARQTAAPDDIRRWFGGRTQASLVARGARHRA